MCFQTFRPGTVWTGWILHAENVAGARPSCYGSSVGIQCRHRYGTYLEWSLTVKRFQTVLLSKALPMHASLLDTTTTTTTTQPNNPTTRPPNHPTTQPPDHPTTQPPNHPTTQQPNNPTTRPPNHPTNQPPNQPTTQPTNSNSNIDKRQHKKNAKERNKKKDKSEMTMMATIGWWRSTTNAFETKFYCLEMPGN